MTMTVTAVQKDASALSMTVVADFPASPERVWQLWSDPRQLGGRVTYHMTGPGGDQPRGYWDVDEVQPPHRLTFRDGFLHDDGTVNPDLPTTVALVTIEDAGNGQTRMSIESHFPSTEAMEQLLAMGMEEGMKQAVGQIDAILAEDLAARV